MTTDPVPPNLLATREPEDSAGSAAAEATPGPGRMIRAAREQARLSLEELANQTRLARSTLDALERDDFATLTEAVYVRGYYRKCASVLALDETQLLAAYQKLAIPRAPQAPSKLLLGSAPVMAQARSRRRGLSGRLLVVLAILAIVGTVIWVLATTPHAFGRLNSGTATSEAAPAPDQRSSPPQALSPAAEPVTSEPASAPETAPQTAPQTAPETTPEATPAAPSAAPTDAPALTPTAATAVTPAAADVLTLQFHETSWIRIEDASGALLLSGLFPADDRKQVSGTPPYDLFIGNAPGVEIDYRGRPIDTTAYVKANATARLSVP